MRTKKCSCSPEPKPISDFRKHTGYGDGYQNKCKKCEKEAAVKKALTRTEKFAFVF